MKSFSEWLEWHKETFGTQLPLSELYALYREYCGLYRLNEAVNALGKKETTIATN